MSLVLIELRFKIIGEIMNWKKWLVSVWSEADGTGSSSRLIISLLVLFIITVGVGFTIAVHKHSLAMNDFNSFLVTSGAFIVTTCTPLYAVNKGAAVMKGKTDAAASVAANTSSVPEVSVIASGNSPSVDVK